jgi:hypothetical protein
LSFSQFFLAGFDVFQRAMSIRFRIDDLFFRVIEGDFPLGHRCRQLLLRSGK